MDIVIWHNPKCSKSRQALALLEERNLAPVVRRYLDDAPSKDELAEVVRQLGSTDPQILARKKEGLYTELGVGEMDGDAVLEAMAANPRIIERPVVITQKGARIGRPTEAILEVL